MRGGPVIADLLAASRDAHQRYRENLPRRVPNGSGSTVAVPGDADAAGTALSKACRFRSEAHVLDPQQTDPAWADDPAEHLELLDFYVGQLNG